MPKVWSGRLADLRQLVEVGILQRVVKEGFHRAYGASPAELAACEQSLRELVASLAGLHLDYVQTVVELQMPVGAERADVVLLGGRPPDLRGYILEFKLWSEGMLDPQTLEVDVPGLGLHQHPSAQALNYRGKLRLFHSRACQYDLKAAAVLPNMGRERLKALAAGSAASLVREAPLFGREDREALAQAIEAHLLPSSLDDDEHITFSDAPFEQTRLFFDVVVRHASDIATRAVAVLAESGIGLTQEQELLVEEILSALRSGGRMAFIVQGGTGSGKTLLAVTLLLRAVQEGYGCVLALRNNRLQAILRRCFDLAYRGASGCMLYFEVPGRGTGIGDERFKATFDLVICDEAQRMRNHSMPITLARAPVSALFLDETQRLNPPEDGTIEAFAGASLRVGATPAIRRLATTMRCRGGQPYLDWLEVLLGRPEDPRLPLPEQPWRSHYLFEVCESPHQLLSRLSSIREELPGRRVAMVASFTESPGSMSHPLHPSNVRIGYPLDSSWDYYENSGLTIRWLMRPEEYVQFWMKGQSNDLDRVASIYGAQGFESDYVGVVWGRDLLFRNGAWILGDPNVCYDTIDRLVRGQVGNRSWTSGALELLRNRYRIFLTRGILGTLVLCEDPETREYMLSLIR